jgi:hypothetical protein
MSRQRAGARSPATSRRWPPPAGPAAPRLRAGPGQRRRRDVCPVPGQARHQGVLAPPGHVPLGEQHRDERAGQQALADRLRRPGRRHRRRDPAAAGPPVPAAAARHHPHRHLPVQLLHDVIAQPGERLPAPRAAVPTAGKVPDHPGPGQMRVIPPAGPRPQPARPAALTAAPAAAARVPAAARIPGRRPRPRPLRRPPEHQPLQHRQLRRHPLKLGLPLRVTLTQPGVLLPQPLVLPPQPPRPAAPSARSPPPPGPGRQHPHPRPRQPGQSRSTANTITTAESRITRGVPHPAATPPRPSHTISDYLRPSSTPSLTVGDTTASRAGSRRFGQNSACVDRAEPYPAADCGVRRT